MERQQPVAVATLKGLGPRVDERARRVQQRKLEYIPLCDHDVKRERPAVVAQQEDLEFV